MHSLFQTWVNEKDTIIIIVGVITRAGVTVGVTITRTAGVATKTMLPEGKHEDVKGT